MTCDRDLMRVKQLTDGGEVLYVSAFYRWPSSPASRAC